MRGDHVDVYGVAGLGSNLIVTIIDETHFSVPGTLSGAYTGGGFTSSHGAPAYYWDTTKSRGDYLLLKWYSEWRTWAERDRVIADYQDCLDNCAPSGGNCAPVEPANSTVIRPHQGDHGLHRSVASFEVIEACLPFQTCAPSVICISPNGETWPNGITYEFPEPSEVVADERFGGPQWIAMPVIAMNDVFWQRPRRACIADDNTFRWKMDDGTCQEDTLDESGEEPVEIHFYPTAPLVEPRASLPGGGGVAQDETAPALPDGLYLGWLSLADMNLTTLPPGNPTIPPPPPGGQLALPFDYFDDTLSCAKDSRRFGEIYTSYYA